MGLAAKSPVRRPLAEEMVALLQKAGYEVIFPQEMDSLCCGTIWESKGMPDVADRKTADLEAALWAASDEGKYPVLCDQSPCLHRMRKKMTKMKLYEPVEFIYTYLLDKLIFSQIDRPVAVHITCSTRLMGVGDMLIDLVKRCSSHGKMAWLKAYGNKEIYPKQLPMTTNTVFDMASCSKSMINSNTIGSTNGILSTITLADTIFFIILTVEMKFQVVNDMLCYFRQTIFLYQWQDSKFDRSKWSR